MQYAQTLLQQLEDTHVQCSGLLQYNDCANTKEDRLLERHELQALRDEVDRVCLVVNGYLQSHGLEKDVIDEVFFLTDEDDDDSDDDGSINDAIDQLDVDDDDSDDEFDFDFNEDGIHPTTAVTTTTTTTTEEEYHTEMQETLESEIAEMASRLKQSSLAMNESLKAQNEDVDRMTELTHRNLDDVTNIAGNVEDRLRTHGWRKTFGTWSLVFMIGMSFVGVFMVMRVVPKRKNVCVSMFGCQQQYHGTARRYYQEEYGLNSAEKSLILDEDETVASSIMSSSSSSANGDGCDEESCEETYEEVRDDHGRYEEDDSVENDDESEEEEEEEIEEYVCTNNDCYMMEVEEGERQQQQQQPPLDMAQNLNQQRDHQEEYEYVHTVTEEQYTTAQLYLEIKKAAVTEAREFNLDELSRLLQMNNGFEALNSKDINGWQIIHEVSRTGNVAVVQLLHEHGANINEVANFGRGATPLFLAKQRFGDHHPIVSYLQSQGGV